MASTPAPPAEDDDDHLSVMMSEILRDFSADGILITQRGERGEAVVLFSDGACDAARDASLGEAGAGPEWLALAGEAGAAMLTTSVPASGGTITVRTVFRRFSETTRAQARVASARLQPLLQPFARAWWQRRRAQARVRALTRAIDRADIGVVLVDARGMPTFANAAARALIAQGDGLRMRGAMLGGATLADTLKLHAAVEHVISAEVPDAAAPVVALPRTARRPLMAAVVAAQAAGVADDADAPAAIVYLFDPEEDLAALIEPACKLYGLSPVETRLTCLLADGVSLAAAAAAMRVREMTARSYLKQIFLKTDTNRQAELVWLMLKSTVRTRGAGAAGAMAATLV
ncbi:helix-turn-helix transcriptional regulator [Sphingomonas corticis]|jgi:DNA-binding CsgD family transcriptional regulator|uniref:Helix-turn-helix transcriptional regulator n=1 Tax=Sphingomonas corticis TaxID=2722791 RepID=A0ABX1CRC9_9SPHN|nr:helix-turn-helix transcriptional regulator [Sphingomonas corticis]NJR79523.1 helix-turn-helix transcriptional regulator [Sphingomonas corticis]